MRDHSGICRRTSSDVPRFSHFSELSRTSVADEQSGLSNIRFAALFCIICKSSVHYGSVILVSPHKVRVIKNWKNNTYYYKKEDVSEMAKDALFYAMDQIVG